ncbi:hypothetical protein M231_03406 [Tremella mesenterica]|uniref:Uncharacterized protein n=1 Tax=Tremella mesenterica TaxID=5217 RepID=A0A4V1M469_TREME|nr:hypothetical protein M231_03406 [Tremella mesenterica]
METVTSTAIGFGWPHDEERILHGKLIESTDHPHLHLRIGTEQNYLDWQKSDASCTVVVTWPGWKLTWWVVENGGIEPEEQDEDVLEAQDVEGEGAEGAEGADETDEEEDEEDDENDQNDGDGDDETEDDGPPGHVSHQTQYLEGDAFRLIYKEYAGYRGVTLLGIHPTQTVQEVVLWGDRCRLPDGSFKLRLQALRQPPYVRDLSNLDEPVDLTKEPYIPTDE